MIYLNQKGNLRLIMEFESWVVFRGTVGCVIGRVWVVFVYQAANCLNYDFKRIGMIS
jgi:hypothetical protein